MTPCVSSKSCPGIETRLILVLELPPHKTSVQYCGGCSVYWRLFSILEVVQYIGGIASVLWGDSFSTVEDSVSTVRGSFSTVEFVQYSGG